MLSPVVLTRAVGANAVLGAALTAAGIPWEEWPALGFEAAPCAPDALADATALAFVSPGAVSFATAIPWPDVPRVAQGPGTARALADLGLPAHKVAVPPDATGLAAAIVGAVPPGIVALLCGDHARDIVWRRLQNAGYTVRRTVVYRNVEPPDLARPKQGVRAVVYASPTAVRRHLRANPWLRTVPSVVIGPTTAAALPPGARIHIARAPTPEALLAALLEIT